MNKKQIILAIILGLVAVWLTFEITHYVDKIYFDKTFRNNMESLERHVEQMTYYGDSLKTLVTTDGTQIDKDVKLTLIKDTGYKLSSVLEITDKEYKDACDQWKRYGTLEDKDKLDRYGFNIYWYKDLLRNVNRFYYGKQ